MSIFSDNIRYLRSQLEKSQREVADDLLITRVRYAKYEGAESQPPIELLLKISKYYNISIDLLVSVDIRKYPLDEILSLPDNRIVLPITVDSHGENRIEIIPHRATMGYLEGYSDPEYIESLQTISLPFLKNGTFRAFPAEGDSMPPYNNNTFIVGKFIENIELMNVGKSYIFVTRSEGITYKRYHSKSTNGIIVSADNSFYQPYEILASDLFEMWEFACSVITEELILPKDDLSEIKDLMVSLVNDKKKEK